MKPAHNIVILLLLFGAAIASAQTTVTATRFDKHYARISIQSAAVDSQTLADLDSVRAPVRRVDGNLLDLRKLNLPADSSASALLSTLLARFADEPLVIQADSTRGTDIFRLLINVRQFTELEFSADSVKAVKRLKRLAAEFRTQRQDRMDNLFRK